MRDQARRLPTTATVTGVAPSPVGVLCGVIGQKVYCNRLIGLWHMGISWCASAADVVKGSKRQAQRVWRRRGREKAGEKETRRPSRFLLVSCTCTVRGNAANVGQYLPCLAKVTGVTES